MEQVTIYTRPDCKYCEQAKAFMDKHGIAYQGKDVSDPDALKEMLNLSGARTVPVTVTEFGIILGFSEETFKSHFDIA